MDPNEALDNLRALARAVLVKEDYSRGTVKSLAAAFANLDTWLGRGGFAPEEWTKNRPEPKVEVFHNRYYDGDCYLAVYLDGEEAGIDNTYDHDPGRGHDFRDYAQSLAWDVAHASPKLKGIVYESAWNALTDRYTENQPDDVRVAERYFDLLIADEEAKYAGDCTGTGTALHPTACEGVAR